MLEDEEIQSRIKEEHERAKLLDEKIFKITLSLTLGLTIINSTFAFLIQQMDGNLSKLILMILIGLSVTYVFIGGFIAFAALTTQRVYGFGTEFLIQRKNGNKNQLCRALNLQEESNLIRHIRNEIAYQCLRNGFCLLFLVFMFYCFNVCVVLFQN